MNGPTGAVRFDVVRVRVGAATVPLMDDDRLEFYRSAVHALTGSAGSFVGDGQDWRCITTETANEKGETVRKVAREALASTSPEATWLILDLTLASLETSPSQVHLRGSVNLLLAQEINELLDSRAHECTVVVLLSEVPPEQDLVRVLLSDAIDGGRVVLVGDNGDAAPPIDPTRSGAYKRVIANERGNDLDLLRAKLVRRKGWFSRGDRGYVRFFYELSRARDELHHELTRRLSDLPVGARIVSYGGISRWLEEPLNSAALQVLGPSAAGVSHFATMQELEEALSSADPTQIAVVVPMVDTSKTIKAIRDKLVALFPTIPLRLLSVLSSQGPVETDGVRQLAGGLEVSYLLRVEQIHVQNTAQDCDAELLRFQDSLMEEAGGHPLRPYQFWDLIRDANPVDESNPPEWRPEDTGALMPDFEAMMVAHGYGPWLAVRLWRLFDGHVSALPRDTLFVCPEGETNSDTLADSMRRTVGVRIVRIPRSAIEHVKRARFSPEAARNLWDADNSPWMRLLRSSGQTDVVIMDDIVVTSASVRAIRTILEAGGFLVTGVACLADYSVTANPEVRALYSYPRPSLADPVQR
ncbi:MAG: hypothetical protein JWR52_1169 [Marmoricola sp.]|nr:hypothetical protein [Marmoricola sp.]